MQALKVPNCQFKVFRESSLISKRITETHARNIQINNGGSSLPLMNLETPVQKKKYRRMLIESELSSESNNSNEASKQSKNSSSDPIVITIPFSSISSHRKTCSGPKCSITEDITSVAVTQPSYEIPDCEIKREFSH